MDIKKDRQYNYMIAEYSCWDDGIEWMGIDNELIKNKRFIVTLQKMPTAEKKLTCDSRGFDNLYDVIDVIAGRTNVCQVVKHPIRYLYFDVDKIELEASHFEKFIADFLTLLNAKLIENDMTTEPIMMNDLQIHTKCRNEKIISIHLIVTKYCMNFKQMLNLAKLINLEDDSSIEVDTAIYDKTRRFFNCFCGKIGKETFQYHELNSKPYELIWIDDTTSHDTTTIDFTLEPKQEVVTIEMDIVPFLLEHKEKYLKRSHSWFVLMLYVKYSCEMTREDFCQQSLTDGWNYEDNLCEWDNADTTYAIKTIEELTSRMFNKRFIRNPINNKFFEYINAPTQLRNELLSISPEIMNFNIDGLTFDKKSGLLTHDGKTTLYYADTHRQPIHTDTIDVSQAEIYDTIKDKKHIFINALYGGGKTHFVIAPIIMDAIKDGMSVLVITENNSLNKQYADDKRLNLISHLKKVDAEYQVSSLESLWKLKQKKYDVIVLDELLSLMTHFHSSKTMRGNEIKIYNKLIYYIGRCEKCVVCDADLTANTFTGFLDMIEPNRSIHKIIVPKYENYTYNIVFEKAKIVSKIMDDLKNGLKIICACDIKQTAKSLQEAILTMFKKEKNVLSVVGNETGYGYLFNGEELDNEKNDFLFKNHTEDADYDPKKKYDLKEFVELFKIDAMIYSPKIKTGISINGYCFDRQYGIGSGRSVTSREFIQMIHRARDLNDTNIWVSLPKPRTDKDLSKINAEYVERMYDDGTNILNEILCGDKISHNTRDGLTEILAEGCGEIRRSKICFTTEFYNSIINLGLKLKIHLEDLDEVVLQDTETEVKKWLSLGLPTLNEIDLIVKKMMEDDGSNVSLTSAELVTMKYLRYFLKYETTYSPKPNQLKRYNFYGLFEYDKLEAFLNRTDEKEIYSFLDINRIRNNRERYVYENTLSHDEMLELHSAYVDKSTKQQILDDATRHTALYFFKMLMKLKDDKGYIKKSLIKFSNKDLQILNAIYKHERKNKTELVSFNSSSKIEDIMRFISKITHNNYGSKFIVSNTSRGSYREVAHSRLIVSEYNPTFEARLKDKDIDIEKIGCRASVNTDVKDGFFKVRKPLKKTILGGRYSTKTDIYDNKIIKRKMNSSLYKTATPNWILSVKPHPNDSKKQFIFYQKADDVSQFFFLGIYEPVLNNVFEMSKFKTDFTENALLIYKNPYKKPKEPTADNPIILYQNIEEVVENTHHDEDFTHSVWHYSDKVAKPNDFHKNRNAILLRELKYKIRTREKIIAPSYEVGDVIIETTFGYCFVFENISKKLKFYQLTASVGFNFKVKYEPDFSKEFKFNHVIDGYYINEIYITHLEVSKTHNLINIKKKSGCKDPIILEETPKVVEPQIDYHKIKKMKVKESRKDWVNGIQYHLS